MAEVVTSEILDIEPIDLSAVGFSKDTLKGEVALVTGGSSNVGLGYARALALAGAKVVVADLNEKTGKETERVINAESAPDTAFFVKCDVSRDDDVKNLAKRAFEKFGKVDILVNNAMNMRLNGLVLNSPVSDLDQSYAISGHGVMLAIKEFVPAMIERGHGVVVYSSTQFHYCLPMVGSPIYCAGKAAATSIIMSLANEVKGTGVSVFCLTPTGVGRFDEKNLPPIPDWVPNKDKIFESYAPGFNTFAIPPEAAGAGMVYCILNASTLHGSGVSMNEVFDAMKYPYPNPETVLKRPKGKRLSDMELSLVFLNMGPGFSANLE